MTPVDDRLTSYRDATADPAEATVAQDLARGRAAKSRQRRRRGAVATAGLTLSFGLALGAVTVLDSVSSDGGAVTAADTSRTGGVDLVAYDGEQPAGFEVTTVPRGFFLQGSTPETLTLAPEGDTTSPDEYVGKLAVMLKSADAPKGLPPGEPVTVGGRQGVLYTPVEAVADPPTTSEPGVLTVQPPPRTRPVEDARVLAYLDGDHVVMVQRVGVEMTDAQLVEFAEGVTVTADVEPTFG